MDAKSVWPGFDYAHTFDISRGIEYYPRANRVRAIAVYDKKLPGNTRATTFVKVQFLNSQTQEPIDVRAPWNYEYGHGILDEVRARELFMRWDEYEDETEHRESERKKRQTEEERIREERRIRYETEEAERKRLRDERQAKEEAERLERARQIVEERKRIFLSLSVKGISSEGVVITGDTVIFPKETVRRWLGIAS